MIWWVFPVRADCEAAELAARTRLGPDTDSAGEVAPVQITQRWADIVVLSDGRFAIPAMDAMSVPSGGEAVSYDSVALLFPQPAEGG